MRKEIKSESSLVDSHELIEGYKNRVQLLDGIIHYKEVKVMSSSQLDVMWDKVEYLVAEHNAQYMLVDLVGSEVPNAAQRSFLTARMRRMKGKLLHAAMFTQKNILINLSIKFMMSAQDIFPNKVFNTREEAIAFLQDIKQKSSK